ncbi:unnamed protein product [Meloidogyne enterolobii]|uniref:Uncharacterized protein n=1 Tax=Meloidogyne enterolobii TaxID=390850 RepID=A0ACB0YTW8_MELEN
MISELTEKAASLDILSRPELECVTQSCVCSYYGGKTNGSTNDCTLPNGQKVQKALRKEIRLLTEEERNKFFFGTTNNEGYVTTGFFAPWKTLEGNQYISREVGVISRCTTEYDVDWTLSQTNVDNVLAYMYPDKGCPYSVNWEWLEYTHARTHKCVGGDMSYLETSANEVLFPLFHCFVDSVFEEWRQTKQNRTQRVNDYPENLPACSTACHYRNATMTQFPVNSLN